MSVFHVSYKDGSGRTYQEEMTIDFGRIGPALLYGTPLEEAIYPVAESLKKLEEGVKDLSRAVQRLASKAVNSKDEI